MNFYKKLVLITLLGALNQLTCGLAPLIGDDEVPGMVAMDDQLEDGHVTPVTLETPRILTVAHAVVYLDRNHPHRPLKLRLISDTDHHGFNDEEATAWLKLSVNPEEAIPHPTTLVFFNLAHRDVTQLVPRGAPYLEFYDTEMDTSLDALLEYYEQLSDPHNPNVLIKD